ncbi:hypothetical protein DMUE_3591 [Dictyocoela muelleri]|nr:hypothetical protein DMUE_3591 [Dictyocoela muelleri]
MVYIFMKKRIENSYNSIFSYLKKVYNYQPENIIADFELASFNSLRKSFLLANISGCYFHFNQIIIRYLKKNKFLEIYKTNSYYKKFIKYMIFLAFVPHECVYAEFEKICCLSA